MVDANFAAQLAFIQELDRLKAVYRQSLVAPDQNRRENSAEHSWQITLMAFILKDYATEQPDLLKSCQMLLIHDLVEIDAGDTFAFGAEEDLAAQEAKEIAAAKRIFGMLPAAQADFFETLWHEFEAMETPEARFAKAMDRVAPFFQNIANQGGSWIGKNIPKSKVLKRNEGLKIACPDLWMFVADQIDQAVAKGWLLDC